MKVYIVMTEGYDPWYEKKLWHLYDIFKTREGAVNCVRKFHPDYNGTDYQHHGWCIEEEAVRDE